MNVAQVIKTCDFARTGDWLHQFIAELFPICRSITGAGVRQTLKIVQRELPIEIHQVASGTQVFDWTVPKEWNIRAARIKDRRGNTVIDFVNSNLHVLNYSLPVQRTISFNELKPHLFTLPEYPDWIPYRTSYYQENWGFCLTHNQLSQMHDSEYDVEIDASLQPGHLTYGEFYLPGQIPDEILLSCHICHPSLANDNLSGIALVTFLASTLSQISTRYSYRFLFIPGTIGAITWLCLNEAKVKNISHGLVVACVGDPGRMTYKKSRKGNAEIDRTVEQVLKHSGQDYASVDFIPYGYDERQFCSPGFNLPVGSLTRTPNGKYPQYHTSADNLDLVQPQYLADSARQYLSVLSVLENNFKYINLNPKCEPQLGKRGLYQMLGGGPQPEMNREALLWVLNLSDGENSLLDIAERANLPFEAVRIAAEALLVGGLVKISNE